VPWWHQWIGSSWMAGRFAGSHHQFTNPQTHEFTN
jgi:predicted RNA binding protein YcfA (HicA-like mRNA interferase family)